MSEITPAVESHGAAAVLDPPIAGEVGGDGRLTRGAVAWSLFEGARNPYIILITIYIFAPYVAAVMVGDPIRGQEVISRWSQYGGWVVMATAPILGSSIDKLGRRKIWLALAVAAMVPMMFALWFAKPDGSGLSVTATMLIITTIGVLFSFTEVLHNSLLVRAAGLGAAHKASGLALALGNAFAVGALGFTAWAFALPGKVTWAWVPAHPLFGLDPATHEPQRVVALLAAGIFGLGALPLFFFTPDAPPTGTPVLKAFGDGFKSLVRMVMTVGHYKDAAVYLASRMFYVDGMNAVLIYAGVYATGVMKWGPLEMLFFGIFLSVLAVLGGFVGRWMDEIWGPKGSVRVSIGMSLLGIVAFLGMAPDKILYLWAFDPKVHAPLWNGPFFTTWPEVIFILIGFSNAIFITAQYASSRTLLTRLTPPEQTGAFFGVYALSGVATGWLGPMMVNLGTKLTHTQQGGFATITILLAIGFIGLMFVRGGGRRPA
ncbi:MFS transporter [Phenylobacterium aquaticum]|uniref:MFS transporter n=1 Tax=Phenylobacterium aquaticum TaxID=1763816 RepID=UPI001F5E18F4|nr:MFS transporter [Phenylobacterium aquaticum]